MAQAAGAGTGAVLQQVTNAVTKVATTISDISPLPKTPAPVNYLTWIIGFIPTALAGVSGLWGFFAGVFGVLFLIYTVLAFVASATDRVIGKPVLDFISSLSDKVEDETTKQLSDLGSRREKLAFVGSMLGWWFLRCLLSAVLGPLLFAIALIRDFATIVLIGLMAHTWMYVTTHMKPFVGFAKWLVNVSRTTWNFTASGVNGINAVSARWLSQLYNLNVVYSVAFFALLLSLFNAPALGRVLQQEPATFSPTLSAQQTLDSGVAAQIPGVEEFARRYESLATGATVVGSGFFSVLLGTTEALVPVVRPIFPVFRDNFPQITQVLGCSVTWVGAQCSVRQGISTVLDVVESGVKNFFSLVGVSTGDLNWSKGVKCSQSDAGSSVPCGCSKESGGIFDGIEPCCAPTPSCRTDPVTGQYFEMYEGCGQSYPGASSPDKSIGCPNTWGVSSSGGRRVLTEYSVDEVAWQTSVAAHGACVWYCDSFDAYVRLCPLAWTVSAQRVVLSEAPAPECAQKRNLGSVLTPGVSRQNKTTARKPKSKPKNQISEWVREQLSVEQTECGDKQSDAAGRHAETACLFGVAKRASERMGLSGAPEINRFLEPVEPRRRLEQETETNAEFGRATSELVRSMASHRVAALWEKKSKSQPKDVQPPKRRTLAEEMHAQMPLFVRRRLMVAPDLMGSNFVDSVVHIVRETSRPWEAEKRVREAKRRLRTRFVAPTTAPSLAPTNNETLSRRELLLCASGRYSARTDCSCPYECPDGTCSDSGAQCPYPTQWTIGVAYEWYLLKAELAVSQFDAVVFAGQVTQCWKILLPNDEVNPVSFQNAALTYDQRLADPKLIWCWPMIKEWPFGSLHGSEFDLEVWIASRCTSAAVNEEPCACSSYWGFHYEVDIMWMDGIPYFQPARYHDGMLAGWHLFTSFATRDTWVDHTWQFLLNPWYPAVPRWLGHLFGDQGQKGNAQEQRDCAAFYFGSTLWVLVMIRITVLLFVTVGYLAIVRVMELIGIVELALELCFESFAKSREFRTKAKGAITTIARKARYLSPASLTEWVNEIATKATTKATKNKKTSAVVAPGNDEESGGGDEKER